MIYSSTMQTDYIIPLHVLCTGVHKSQHCVTVKTQNTHGEVYSIQRYVISLSVSCGRSVVYPVSSTNKTDRHDITEILLKVALNTITKPIKLLMIFWKWNILIHIEK